MVIFKQLSTHHAKFLSEACAMVIWVIDLGQKSNFVRIKTILRFAEKSGGEARNRVGGRGGEGTHQFHITILFENT